MLVLGHQLGMSPGFMSHMIANVHGLSPRSLSDETEGLDQRPQNHGFDYIGRRWTCSAWDRPIKSARWCQVLMQICNSSYGSQPENASPKIKPQRYPLPLGERTKSHSKSDSRHNQRIGNEPDATSFLFSRHCPNRLLPFRGFEPQAPRMLLRLSRWTVLRNHGFDGKSRKSLFHRVFDEWISQLDLVVGNGGDNIQT
jgi:hypothetical protein